MASKQEAGSDNLEQHANETELSEADLESVSGGLGEQSFDTGGTSCLPSNEGMSTSSMTKPFTVGFGAASIANAD